MPRSRYIGNPAFRVHTHTGTFLRALQGKLKDTRGPIVYRIWADTSVAPYAAYVIQGTRIMLGRDVIWSTVQSEGVHVDMMRGAVRVLGKALRTQSDLRFTTDPKGSVNLTIMNIRNKAITMRQANVAAATVMGATALGHVKRNSSMTDHTLEDLANFNPPHPYARRHGRIRIHN